MPKTSHVAVLATRRRALPLRLLQKSDDLRITVIADQGHTHVFGPSVTVREIATVRDPGLVLETVSELSRKDPVDRIVSPVELAVPSAGYVRSTLGIPGDSYDMSLAFSNKFIMKQRLAAAGLPTAAFRQVMKVDDVPEAAAHTGWPCVTKPVFGGGCMGVTVLDSPEDHERLLSGPAGEEIRNSTTPLIVEQFIEMDHEYHCDAVVRDGKVVFAAPSRYFSPILGQVDTFSGSYLLPQGHEDFTAVTELNAEVVRALGLTDGVTHLELFKTGSGFVVGEIACRPGGGGITAAVQRHHGVDLWDVFWEVSLGRTPDIAPRSPEGILATVMLPTRPGRITGLSTEAELAACPGVVAVNMSLSVGDVVPPDLTSATTTGLVFFTARDEAEMAQHLHELSDAYVLEVGV
ncbi:ATP-grasp domain-containing protein [Streptomyces pacificus]|uniref:ATP-grasp domain-containing protein n=1 Tax=Streptomyces pacificus TaxID=2705029 RepID=A0A6A0AS53_9ACTN|nr:ATP-grasp domain-containing protein [Streptomyces pacificus]GFH35759.1 ATP-grasp domain-containing protein [Streptomyces pacificus]